MPDTPSERREANEKIPGQAGKLGKYKWWLIGGLGAIAVIVFLFVRKSGSGSTGTSSLAAMGIDPATGVPYAQEYANSYGAGMGFSPFGGGFGGGGTGPAGPPGATGPRGRRGKTGPRGPGDHDHHKHDHKHHKKGSRTEAMSAAVGSRRAWNTRIVPHPNKSTHMV